MENLDALWEEIACQLPDKIILSGGKNTPYQRIVFQGKVIDQKHSYQIEKYTEKQVFHQNILPGQLAEALKEWFQQGYRQCNAFAPKFQYEVRLSKKGKALVQKKRLAQPGPSRLKEGHNKEKNYILKEGTVIPPLVDLGVFTAEGKVVRSMYNKYKQINRFIEIVDDAAQTLTQEAQGRELTIIDFGCGKSYLTFILYYYFTIVKGAKVKMIGLDLKEDVIANCSQVAKKYGYEGLSFQLGDINGFRWEGPVDMVITLHACDTATDYALYNAIGWNTKMIFSVPCCQHELNGQMNSGRLSLLTRYGLIQERAAALFTDAIRGNLLEACGYKTQLLEFVDFSHSPKNILIRAVRGKVSPQKRAEALAEVQRAMEEFHLSPTLYRLLAEKGLISPQPELR